VFVVHAVFGVLCRQIVVSGLVESGRLPKTSVLVTVA
jgi:hypothetical protein